MGLRFNPPPGWPPPPEGFAPGPGWRPDPAWPPPPPGWQLWVPDAAERGARSRLTPRYAGYEQAPPPARYRQAPPPARYRQAPASGPPPPATAGTSGVAIAAFVLGLVGVWILGIVLGIVAHRRIRRTFQQGSGLATAGIVLSCVWLVLIVLVVAIGLRSHPVPTPSSASSASGGASSSRSVDPFSLRTGDCFDNPTPTPGQAQTLTTVVQMACTQPHNAQIFATFTVSGSLVSYPGDAKMHSLASSGCTARVQASLDATKLTDSMSIRFLYPLQQSWVGGHRTVSCIVFNPTKTLKSSLMKG